MIDSWEIGVIVYIKWSGKTPLINFGPSTLLSSIYKIWDTAITNRLTHITNMLTEEGQHAYKPNKSTTDVIYDIKRDLVKKRCNGRILLGLSKAFGGIRMGGDMEHFIWKRVSVNITSRIKKREHWETIRSKQNGKCSREINNNIGVPQCAPLVGDLFIICADRVMAKYSMRVKNTPIPMRKIRNRQIENNPPSTLPIG